MRNSGFCKGCWVKNGWGIVIVVGCSIGLIGSIVGFWGDDENSDGDLFWIDERDGYKKAVGWTIGCWGVENIGFVWIGFGAKIGWNGVDIGADIEVNWGGVKFERLFEDVG